jgi:hypothetical protein
MRAAVDADFTRTSAEKWAERKALIEQEIAARKQLADTMRASRDALDPNSAAYKSADQLYQGSLGGLAGAQNEAAGLGADPNSLTAQMQSGLTGLRESWGTTSQQIASTFTGAVGGAIDSVSAGLSGILLKTTTWRQGLLNVGQTMLTTVVQGIVKMFTTWIVQRGLAAVASMGWSAKEGAVDAAAKAPGAALTSISSFGVAAAVGIAALIAAMAAFGGFSEGGHTGGGANQVRGVVHGQEYVIPAWMTQDARMANTIAGLEAVRTGGSTAWVDGIAAASAAPSGSGSGDTSSPLSPIAPAAAGSNGKPLRFLAVDYRDTNTIDEILNHPAFETKVLHIGRRDRGVG